MVKMAQLINGKRAKFFSNSYDQILVYFSMKNKFRLPSDIAATTTKL